MRFQSFSCLGSSVLCIVRVLRYFVVGSVDWHPYDVLVLDDQTCEALFDCWVFTRYSHLFSVAQLP